MPQKRWLLIQNNKAGLMAVPGGLWCLIFAPGQPENLGTLAGFHKFRALGSPQFFLEQRRINLFI